MLFSGLKKTKKNVKLSRDVFQGVSLVSGSCKSLKYALLLGLLCTLMEKGNTLSGPLRTASLLFTWTWWPGTGHVQEPPALCAASSQFTATRPSREDFAL